ncbi:sigma-70 family RNA polymerase sigma factor [Paenibacillus maysiensis]|uniref:sigma-70 family RNA polymerase sigma factor n=1 Tax=Paenibacillus maysiensis TaxID=1155954 RepID=UPI00046FB7F1|nr:sigma-70 family RNA polymerase sigma factor [Paenibacillus maysiensis]
MNPYILNFTEIVSILSRKKIINEFLNDPEHYALFKESIMSPSDANNKELDEKFKQFFLELRFTTYISSLIHYASIDFDKKQRRIRKRNVLLPEEDSHNLFKDVCTQYEFLKDKRTVKIEDVVTSSKLHKAISLLTEKEKSILSASYVMNCSDTEIAKNNNVSQQAVSKTRTRALKKLRDFLA